MKLFQKAFPENLLQAQHQKKEEQDATAGSLLEFVFMKLNDSYLYLFKLECNRNLFYKLAFHADFWLCYAN